MRIKVTQPKKPVLISPNTAHYFRAMSVAAFTLALLSVTICMAADTATLTLYSAQHEQMVDLVTRTFTKETGIQVRVHSGEAPEIANQIAQEGERSPADIYFTENSPELTLLDEKGLLAKIDPATLKQVPSQYSAADGNWVGVLARESVLAFNPDMIQESRLPPSLLDLARPEWKGKIAIAPSDADFLPLVQAVVALKGQSAALDWLKGLKQNAQVFDDDEGVVAAVDRGTVATGVINNYYWARLRTEKGAKKMHSQIHHFANGDLGGLVNVSGAAVLASSKNPETAQRFVAFLVSKPVQTMIGKGDIDFEYPLAEGVSPNSLLKPFDQLQPPQISMEQLGDDKLAAQLLRQAGLL
jgi:iron(III) transport system substrate-binding protein